MSKRITLALVPICAALSFSLLAQDNNIAVDYWQTVDFMKTAQYEEGMKQHLAWRKEKGDTWRWDTWQLVRGEDLGLYLTSSGDHSWEDFDSPPLGPEAGANYMSHVGDSLVSMSASMATTMMNVSKFPDAPMADQSLAEVWAYTVKPGKQGQFMEAVRRFHEAAQKVNWEGKYIWVSAYLGGEPAMVLVLPRSKWADFKPLEKDPDKVVEEAFGRQESILLMERFADSISSMESSVWMYRADLSYIPN